MAEVLTGEAALLDIPSARFPSRLPGPLPGLLPGPLPGLLPGLLVGGRMLAGEDD